MRTPPLTGPGIDPAESTIPTPHPGTALSARTVAWLAAHPGAQAVVYSVWTRITALERAGQHPGTLAALRFILIHHQPPTRTGHCPTCRRRSWRQLWRHRPFPCVIWRQIRGELLGHLTTTSGQTPRHRTRSSRTGRPSPGPDRSVLLTGNVTWRS